MIEELYIVIRNIKVMSHWQVKEERASASRLQKHEITCVKHFRKCFTKVKDFHESVRFVES